MEKQSNFPVSLLLFIVFTVLGTAAGYYIGKSQAELMREGKFSSWNKLDGSLRFEEIVDATSQMVWAKTADGTLYLLDANCAREPDCNKWIQTKEIPADIHEYGGQSMERGSSCPPSNLKYFSTPPGNLIECVCAISFGMDIMPGKTVYYALMDDGEIWTWKLSYSTMDDIVYTILCTCPGFIFGIVAFASFMKYRRKNKVKQDTKMTILGQELQ